MDKKDLLERFLKSDSLTSTELDTIIGWIEDGSLDEMLCDMLDELKPVFDSHQVDWDPGKLKTELFRKIAESNPTGSNGKGKFLFNGAYLKQLGIAASIAIVAGFLFFIYQNQHPVTKQKSEIELFDLVTKTNPIGIKTVIRLQDGSSVYLNAESSIRYPNNFISDRTIDLTGEAFFEVAQGHSSPFVVRAGGLETIALGTSFNVRHYEEFPLEIVLASGEVKVENRSKGEALNLLPGQGVKLQRNSTDIERFTADIRHSKYWKEGTLHLDKLDFMQLRKTLERWYGVKITVNGTIPDNGYFSGTFSNNETLTNVLEAMKFAHAFKFQLNGKKLTIDFTNT
jgi:transmembrane sensor